MVRDDLPGGVIVEGVPTAESPSRMPPLRAMLLLSGSLRSADFAAAIQRSPLDLPISADRLLRELWAEAAIDVARQTGRERLAIRIIADRDAFLPALEETAKADVQVERDPTDFRGTGGVLHDSTAVYADEDYVLVGNAAQMPLRPLGGLVREMAATGADITLVSHADGTHSGLMWIRCGCLRLIPEVGFVDMKEQALPMLARTCRVAVVHRQYPTTLPVRTPSDYVAALRRYHASVDSDASLAGPFAEDWYPKFAIVERGAEVAAGACIHDSIVLRGGRVERGATVVRSVVCPGGVVHRNSVVVDELVSPLGEN
ncbi:MAG TPA: hypothetical protein VHP11_16380 [Tepidisphaeraceae bacterium]|nr:hypothetical protein [Tepidisphaeraceae bacterium]